MALSNQSDKNIKITKKQKTIFIIILLISFFIIIEAGSYLIFNNRLSDRQKTTIKVLCNEVHAIPRKLPNTFWHHDNNPEHPIFKDKVNIKGTIGDDFTMPKPQNEFRIICLGDSTVEGLGVKANQTFSYFLEKNLNQKKKTKKDIKVINAGIGAHNSAFNLAYLAFRLIHYKPDIVIIKSSYNDYLPYCMPGMNLDYTHAFPEPFHLQIQRPPFWMIARHSYFLKLCGSVFFMDELINPFGNFLGKITKDQIQKVDYSYNKNKFYLYAENIRSMILLCKHRNINVFVLDLPTSENSEYYGNDKDFSINFRKLIEALENELERITFEENVPFIITKPLNDDDFWDHCHNTEKGNKKIAHKISNALYEQINSKAID